MTTTKADKTIPEGASERESASQGLPEDAGATLWDGTDPALTALFL